MQALHTLENALFITLYAICISEGHLGTMTSPEWRALVALLPFLFICNCWLLFQSSFLFPAWTLALDCTRMLIFQLEWLFELFWLSSPLGLTHAPAAGVPWQLILHFSPVNDRPAGQESTHHSQLVRSVWMEPGPAQGKREQHCFLHVDYSLSSISFHLFPFSFLLVNGFASFTESKELMRPGWCRFTWDASRAN